MKLEEQFYEISKKRTYTIRDLRGLSASVLYSFSKPLDLTPSRPLNIYPKQSLHFTDFSCQFNCLDNYSERKSMAEIFVERHNKIAEWSQKIEEESKKREEERIKESMNSILHKKSEPLHNDFEGNCWSKSFGLSTDYIKETSQGELHVHAPKGFITGANIDGEPISNYDACIFDLFPGKIKKDNKKW